MRWPWQREQPEEPPAQAPGEPAPAAAADRVAPAGWAFLPPLQRTIGSVQLTSDPARFVGALASWNDPSFSGRMSHLVSAQAPPGVIDVDGGGPVPGDAGYPSGSGEMTLLPPPAPRVRSTPAGYGSLTATVQRVAPDGDAAESGALDDGAADGPSLLAGEPMTFPVLHVDPGPLQRSDAGPQSPSTMARSVPDTDATGPVASDSAIEAPTPAPAREAFWSRLPGESRLPGSADTSTSNGGATYVQIPTAPAMQRSSSGRTESAPSFGQVLRPGKLGLGTPLSFSEPTPDLAGATQPPPGHLSDPFPSPVQRAAHDISVSPLAHPAVDGADVDAVEDRLPDPANGTPGLQAQEKLPNAESGPAPEAAVPTPSEDESAPPLTAASPPGTLEPAGDGRTVEDGPAPQAGEASPAMPVVSRLGTDVPAAAGEDLGHGSEPQEASPLWTADRGSLHEPPEDTLVNNPAPPLGDGVPGEQPDTQPDTESLHPLGAQPGAAGTRVVEPAAIPLLQRSHSAHSSTALQHPIFEGAYGATVPPAEGQAFPAELPLPPHGPGVSRSTDDPWGSGQAAAGKLDQPSSTIPATIPSAVSAGERIPDSENALHTRAISTSAGPFGLRIVLSPGRESSPQTWQRLTSMAVEAPHLARHTAGSTEPSSAMPLIASVDTESDSDDGSGAGMRSSPRPAAASDAEAMDHAHVAADAAAEASADVGRVIQRTISVQGSGAGEREDQPSSGAPALLRTVQGSLAQPPTEPRSPVVSLQRGGASVTATPATAWSTASPWAHESGFPGPAPGGFHNGQAVQPPDSRPANSLPLTLSLPAVVPSDGGQSQSVLQRDAEIPPPDYVTASPEAPAPPATAPDGAEGVSAVQGAESAPPGPGLPGAAAKGAVAGAAAAGGAAQASPEQLEELAKRLAGPLIRRIKAEMLLDRERRGLRTDVN